MFIFLGSLLLSVQKTKPSITSIPLTVFLKGVYVESEPPIVVGKSKPSLKFKNLGFSNIQTKAVLSGAGVLSAINTF